MKILKVISDLKNVLNFPDLSGNEVKVKLVDPVFYDKNGDRQNV